MHGNNISLPIKAPFRHTAGMINISTIWKGTLLSLLIAIPSYILGLAFPVIGGAIIAILAGMIVAIFLKNRAPFDSGIKFVSKKVLQWAVVLLGFGMNLSVVAETGLQSLPIIISTITISLVVAFLVSKALKINGNTATLIGVGSSICGGSAIAASAPVIGADDECVAQSISVIFFFNVLAAIIFPILGTAIGFSTTDGTPFGIFAGTAVNDTSSVTACASTWDSMWGLGSATLDKAVTVKLTRTLAIIPITLVLAFMRTRKEGKSGEKVSMRKIFPFFIIYFVLASIITTVMMALGVSAAFFTPFKDLSKFMIVFAMAAIGLNTDIIKLVKTGGKPLVLGLSCWVMITLTSLLLQHMLGLV